MRYVGLYNNSLVKLIYPVTERLKRASQDLSGPLGQHLIVNRLLVFRYGDGARVKVDADHVLRR